MDFSQTFNCEGMLLSRSLDSLLLPNSGMFSVAL